MRLVRIFFFGTSADSTAGVSTSAVSVLNSLDDAPVMCPPNLFAGCKARALLEVVTEEGANARHRRVVRLANMLAVLAIETFIPFRLELLHTFLHFFQTASG
mmetsp:Transcript_21205/g.47816  ORF Transcript_21205/g.47816 Transcript_21205/m.47816 type:complete len:102 (+) Transcript_21205:1115-1420(+)